MDNQEQEQIHQILNSAYFYLKFRPRTEKEVRDYLLKKSEKRHWSSDAIEKAVSSLKENDFVNDNDFVEWFVHQRISGKPKSAFALHHELQKLGVEKDIITAFFGENPLNEEQLAYDTLKRKWSRFKNFDKKERFKKTVAFLANRGFNFAIIKSTFEKLENNE